jgi:hypothetical protein
MALVRHNQPTHCGKLMQEFYGKFTNTSLSPMAKWLAVESVIASSIMYPFVNVFYSNREIQPIISILPWLKCAALGLNHNFPRVLLYGLTYLEGLGLPSPTQKNTSSTSNVLPRYVKNSKHRLFIHKFDVNSFAWQQFLWYIKDGMKLNQMVLHLNRQRIQHGYTRLS